MSEYAAIIREKTRNEDKLEE